MFWILRLPRILRLLFLLWILLKQQILRCLSIRLWYVECLIIQDRFLKSLLDEFGGSVGGGGRYDEMIGKFTGNNTSACGFSIGFERIVMLLLERNYEIPTKNGKKAYLIEKNMPADKMLTILKQAQEERNAGTQINISIMKKNKKFQKDQMTAEGYTEFVEFFKDRM